MRTYNFLYTTFDLWNSKTSINFKKSCDFIV